MMIEDEYVCIKALVVIEDSEYGYHVFAKHGYKEIYVNFHTESDDLILIMKQINKKFKEELKNMNFKGA